MTHLALQTELSAKQRNYMGKVDAAAKGLLGITNGILDFSKIEAGKMEIEHIDFNLEDVMEHLADLSVIKAKDKGLCCSTSAPTCPPRWSAIPCDWAVSSGVEAIAELEQAQMENRPYGLVLMDWHMPDMGGVEAVRRIRADKHLAHTPACIMVTAYSRDELLQRTYGIKLDSLLVKPVSPSTLFDSIMTAFGKEVAHLPRKRQRLADYQDAANSLRGAYILLVEDNEVNQELALEILRAAGISVDVAGNGLEAWKKVTSEKSYDGVLMDCQMPLMDGFEATRKIRADERFATLPVIAMTANAMAGDREKCLEYGMNDHIAKPIDVDYLFAILARWVKPRAPAAATPTVSASAAQTGVPRLNGVDADAALARVGGSVAIYRRLLTRFRSGQADAIACLRGAYQAGDRETATRLAHTLKGLAANIGADKLTQAAFELELAFQHREDDLVVALTAAADESLHALIAEIDRIIPSAGEDRNQRKTARSLAPSPIWKRSRRCCTNFFGCWRTTISRHPG